KHLCILKGNISSIELTSICPLLFSLLVGSGGSCSPGQQAELLPLGLQLIRFINKLDFKRRRTERIRRERIDSPLTSDMENRRRSRANSQSDPIRRGRGRPKSVGLRKQEEEKEKQEKEVDIYASLSDEKAFVFSVALAEINRKILGQKLIL
uniref:Chromosome 16 open reading frame 87 n=1 Tax=Lates calcarifer TaxID=8187 RepID=A0A4W6CVZ2_LATCA